MHPMKKVREYVSSKEISKIEKGENLGLKGSFLIGYINPETNKFRPKYVGVSYNDLMGEIIKSSEKAEHKNFDRYRLVKTKTDTEAWELECKTFHEFKVVNNLTNQGHSKWLNSADAEKLACPYKDCSF
jgi:hypothetical protein